MTRNIDELSNIKTRAVEPKKYFGEMDLDEEQIEERIKYTEKANDMFDLMLVLVMSMLAAGNVEYNYIIDRLETMLLSLIAEFTTPDDYLIDYATDTAYNFVETTQDHIEEPWYLSQDRALFNAENSANDVLNYSEYKKAIEEGKTHKKWITEHDNKVRESHREVTKNPIPIKDFFRVGLARMRFPKDYEYASMFPEELVNCRCTIEYLPKGEERQKENKDNIPQEEKDFGVRNVTGEFIKNSTPGKGKLIEENGFKNVRGEREMADWLHDKFGGDITLLAENNPEGVSNPDYLWDGKLWDLKSPSSSRDSTIKNRLTDGLKQIERNIGGVIMDISNSEIDIDFVERIINKINPNHIQPGTKFIVKKLDEFKVFMK